MSSMKRAFDDEVAQHLQVISTDADNIAVRLRALGVRDEMIEECNAAMQRAVQKLASVIREHKCK